MDQKIEIVDVEAADAVVLQGRIAAKEMPRSIMPLFARVQQLISAGTLPQGGDHVWIYRFVEEGQIDAEVGVLMSGPAPDRDGLVATRTPAGKAAHAVHVGDFSKLMAVNAALQAFCRDQGRATAGVTWEVYSNLDQPPDKRRCDMYLLLK